MSKKVLIEEVGSTLIEEQSQKQSSQPNSCQDHPKSNKALLRFENPIYNVYNQDKYASEKEFMIKKLLAESKKPKFQLLPKSSLLDQVKQFIPMLKKANEEVQGKGPEIQIDTQLQKEESSEEESSEDEGRMVDEADEDSSTKFTAEEHTQKEKPQIELNFLVVPYPDDKPQHKTSDS